MTLGTPQAADLVRYGGVGTPTFGPVGPKALATLALAAAPTAAHAHGEEALLTIGLALLSFFACLVALGVAPRLRTLRHPAGAGALVGLGIFAWPFGSMPYSANETLLNMVAVLAPPVLMLAFAAAAARFRSSRAR